MPLTIAKYKQTLKKCYCLAHQFELTAWWQFSAQSVDQGPGYCRIGSCRLCKCRSGSEPARKSLRSQREEQHPWWWWWFPQSLSRGPRRRLPTAPPARPEPFAHAQKRKAPITKRDDSTVQLVHRWWSWKVFTIAYSRLESKTKVSLYY